MPNLAPFCVQNTYNFTFKKGEKQEFLENRDKSVEWLKMPSSDMLMKPLFSSRLIRFAGTLASYLYRAEEASCKTRESRILPDYAFLQINLESYEVFV